MFAPSFQITNKTLTNLINVEISKKVVELASLQPDWETRLRQDALTRRIYCLYHFLGNGLGPDEISKIVRDEPGRDDKASEVALRCGVVGKEKDIQHILNFLNANKLTEQIAYLTNKFKQTDFGESDLKKLNGLLGERMIGSDDLGQYRTENRDEVGGLAPLAVEIPFQMEDLFGWFRSAGRNEIHPVLKSGTMFVELIRISPFNANNLMTAFCFANLILSSEGYHFKQMWSLEEEILKNSEIYLAAVNSVAGKGGDLSFWMEKYSRWTDEAAEKTKTKVLNLVGETPIFKSGGGRVISLTERQIAIMEEMTLRNEMTIKEIRGVLPMVSDDTILRDLKDLIDKKLTRKKGKTKGAIYVMGKVKSYR
ncbi:MAG: hypothetical protein UW68_C0020G0017 [Candidatus Collierbacteria bacterium GW2011_GWB1_44_6]|uniref:Fido domain-containing protein n=2 Tax=Candidatus Collieribacteriota TaxID=1752725 RepID=A0A0G1JNL4_9BACT|nr:MAG: hypothetical protein UV68_C0031G0005 [Candidatus Collierbacteria bacterium GW2011_GWC2_43_12]KKT72963.1 MAG: hypothetical protein UW68_C0020G0017 [Candidatus Collierbacteria bacterium GW2011_GWB1_44_6]KKT83652.1 MAG: hypothetical protein UW80_C0009G0006 [Microgenomates group bacterium GW2011_GWC1_44_9]